MSAYSATVREMVAYLEPVIAHVSDLAVERLATQPGACDFRFGNPQEMPLPAIERAISKWVVPQNKDWFAYKTSEEKPQEFLATQVSQELDLAFEPLDVESFRIPPRAGDQMELFG